MPKVKFSDEHYQILNVLFGYRAITFLAVVIMLLPIVDVSERSTVLFVSGLLVAYNLLLHLFKRKVLYFITSEPAFFMIDVLIGTLPLLLNSNLLIFNFYSVGTIVVAALLYRREGYILTAAALSIFQVLLLLFSKPLLLSLVGILYVAGKSLTYFLMGFIAFYTAGLVEENINQRKIIREQAQAKAMVEERQRIAREMHDNLAQILAGIKLRSEALQDNAIAEASGEGLQALRSALFSLREDVFENDLSEVLARYCRELNANIGFRVKTDFAGEPSLPQTTKAELFRICQEALHNANKHSGRKDALLSLSLNEDAFFIKIEDFGSGFDIANTKERGFGLKGMQERAKKIGANFQVDSSNEDGTVVTLVLPVECFDREISHLAYS